ncbi:carbohydrate ABC transporter permease [Microbacterium sp.]|uniref:carbohydrate ABC transporter permease n=1 Tax=Microbacterium sp. TaxID=51671 RepID=UPI003341F888
MTDTRTIAASPPRSRRKETDVAERSAISDADRRRPSVRATMTTLQIAFFSFLVIAGVGPILWLAKAALSTTQDTISQPFAWFPHGVQWGNLAAAWEQIQVGRYLANTAVMALGSTVSTVVVTASLAYVISILRPRWARFLSAAILVTLFVPGVISLVPLYLTVVDLPLAGGSIIDSYWAVWLPAAANAFAVLVVTRFFDEIPREIIEAARVDGVGPFRMFFVIVLPFSKSILGVIAVLTILNSWKDFLWPMLVLPSSQLQPISVALARIGGKTDLSLQMSAMLLGLLIPIAVFLVFQRQILKGVSMSGGIKG